MKINTDYQLIEWFESKKILLQTWKISSNSLDQEQFKNEMIKLVALIESKRPLAIIINMTEFEFPVAPTTQEWVNVYINSKIAQIACDKVAFIVSHDLFTKISVEQTLKEAEAMSFESKYFKNIADAEKWV